jgi:hypothetical protein
MEIRPQESWYGYKMRKSLSIKVHLTNLESFTEEVGYSNPKEHTRVNFRVDLSMDKASTNMLTKLSTKVSTILIEEKVKES